MRLRFAGSVKRFGMNHRLSAPALVCKHFLSSVIAHVFWVRAKKCIQNGNVNRTGTWSFTGELPKNTKPRFQKRPRLIHRTSVIVSTKNLCKKPNNLECETRNLDAGASRRKRSDVCCVQEGFWSRTRCSCYGGIFTWSLRTVATLERRSQQLHQYQEIHGL